MSSPYTLAATLQRAHPPTGPVSTIIQGKNILVLYRACPATHPALALAVRQSIQDVGWFAIACSLGEGGQPEVRVAFHFSRQRWVRSFAEFELLGYRPALVTSFQSHFTCCADFYARDPNYHREELTPELREKHQEGFLVQGPRGRKRSSAANIACLQLVLDLIWQELDSGRQSRSLGRMDGGWLAEMTEAHGIDPKYNKRLAELVRLDLRRVPDPARGMTSRPLTDDEEARLFDWLSILPADSEPSVHRILNRANEIITASPGGALRNPCTYVWWNADARKRYTQHRERREAAVAAAAAKVEAAHKEEVARKEEAARKEDQARKEEEARADAAELTQLELALREAAAGRMGPALALQAAQRRVGADSQSRRLPFHPIKVVPPKQYFSTESFLKRMGCYGRVPWTYRYPPEVEVEAKP